MVLGKGFRQVVHRQDPYGAVLGFFVAGLQQHFAYRPGRAARFHPPRYQDTASRFKPPGLETLGAEQENFRIPGFVFDRNDRIVPAAAGIPLHRPQGFRLKNLFGPVGLQLPYGSQMGIINVAVQSGIKVQQVPYRFNFQTGKGFRPLAADSF